MVHRRLVLICVGSLIGTALQACAADLPRQGSKPHQGPTQGAGETMIEVSRDGSASVAIQAALDAAAARGGGTLELPLRQSASPYKVEKTIRWPDKPVDIQLRGEPGVVLELNGKMDTMFEFRPGHYNATLSNLILDGSKPGASVRTAAIYVGGGHSYSFDRVTVRGFKVKYAVNTAPLQDDGRIELTDCRFSGNTGTAVVHLHSARGNRTLDLTNSDFVNNDAMAMVADNFRSVSVVGGYVANNTGGGLSLRAPNHPAEPFKGYPISVTNVALVNNGKGNLFIGNGARGAMVSNCYVEDDSKKALGISFDVIQNVALARNLKGTDAQYDAYATIYGNVVTGCRVGIRINGGNYVACFGNVVRKSAVAGILVSQADKVLVTNNILDDCSISSARGITQAGRMIVQNNLVTGNVRQIQAANTQPHVHTSQVLHLAKSTSLAGIWDVVAGDTSERDVSITLPPIARPKHKPIAVLAKEDTRMLSWGIPAYLRKLQSAAVGVDQTLTVIKTSARHLLTIHPAKGEHFVDPEGRSASADSITLTRPGRAVKLLSTSSGWMVVNASGE